MCTVTTVSIAILILMMLIILGLMVAIVSQKTSDSTVTPSQPAVTSPERYRSLPETQRSPSAAQAAVRVCQSTRLLGPDRVRRGTGGRSSDRRSRHDRLGKASE